MDTTSAANPVAILGAGSVGGNLGVRLAECGVPVRFGVRPGKPVDDLIARCGGRAVAASLAEAVEGCDIVFLCVGSEDALSVAEAAGGLAGRVVVDCTNPVAWDGSDGPLWDPPPEGSVAAALAAALDGARVVKGFCTFGAHFHRTATVAAQPVEVPLAGDDAEAKALVSAIARRAGFEPWDAGPLAAAGSLECLALLWIRRSRLGAGKRFAFQAVADG